VQEFKATTEKQIKVIFGDKEFILNKPRVADSLKLTQMLKGVSEDIDQTRVMINWLDSLGLPEEIVNQMYQTDLVELVEKFLADSKKK
jgi:hypothetical protein